MASTSTAGRRGSRSNGFQLTRVGLWYLAACLVVGLAATNTGNNGLFLTIAMMLAAFIITHVLGLLNVSRLQLDLESRQEIFANRPAKLQVRLKNRDSRWTRRLLIVSVPDDRLQSAGRRRTAAWWVPILGPGEEAHGTLDLILRRRGPRRIEVAQVASLYPNGIFRKGRRFQQDLEVLVYPELFSASASRPDIQGTRGEHPMTRAGQGSELHSLRDYRPGDDPRGIHWKQSARQGALIFQQQSREQNRRLHIVFDNAVGTLSTEEQVRRFERLVSEAATSAVFHLGQGFEVALTTRAVSIPYAGGPRQRRNLLDALACIEPVAETPEPLIPEDDNAGELRLAMESQAMESQVTSRPAAMDLEGVPQ